jgi:arylsulfatase A-like enzyme
MHPRTSMRGRAQTALPSLVVAMCVMLLMAWGANESVAAVAGRRPNVLVIVTDDQRVGTMKVMRKTRRYFRRQGVTYSRAYAPTPICCPARATIFTGRFAHNHHVLSNEPGEANNLDPTETLQHDLDAAGYHTGMYGKFLNHWDRSTPPPYFDTFGLTWGGYYNAYWNLDGRVVRVEKYSTDFLADLSIRFLRRSEASRDRRPWFLYLATHAPHTPFTPEHAYEHAPVPGWSGTPAVFEANRSDKPPFVQQRRAGLRGAKKTRRKQLRTLMSVDDLVRRVMRRLKRLGERRNTLALFLSDNGLMWAEHGVRGKGKPYTESIEIPLFLRWPKRVAPGSRDRRITTLVDVAPTIYDATGVAPSHSLDGRSLLNRAWTRKVLLGEFWPWSGLPDLPRWNSVRTRSWQYIEYYDPAGAVTFKEYYDLKADPWQLRNLLGDAKVGNDPDLGRATALLDRYRACQGSSCP